MFILLVRATQTSVSRLRKVLTYLVVYLSKSQPGFLTLDSRTSGATFTAAAAANIRPGTAQQYY